MKPFDPRLLRLVPRVRPALAALGVVGVLSGVATIVLAFALTSLVVAVAHGQELTRPVVLVVAVFALRMVLGALTELLAARAGAIVSTSLRRALVERWSRLGVEDGPGRSDAVGLAVSGPATIEPYAARFLPALVSAAVVPPLAIATLFLVDWLSALIVLLTVPLLPIFAALIGHATERATNRRWRALGQLAGHFLDVTRGLPTLVTYGRARHQVEQVRAVSEEHRKATMGTLRLAFLSSAALELLATLSVAIVAVTAGVRLANGDMPLDMAMVAILLAPEAYWPIRRVGMEYHSAADGAVALDGILSQLDDDAPARDASAPQRRSHVRDLVASAPDISSASATNPRACRQAVVARGLGYTHPGASRPVLRGLDLDVAPGLTVITGPSGAGKSTLLELLAGLRTPTTGSVELVDASGATARPAGAAHLMTQRPFIAAGSIRDNLTLARDLTDEEIWQALATAGLDTLVRGLPEQLDTPLGDDGFGLSAGQRQRIALARAITATEPVLLLDEPTAHLDAETAEVAHRAIRALADERTVIAVTHRHELLEIADAHLVVEPLDREEVPA